MDGSDLEKQMQEVLESCERIDIIAVSTSDPGRVKVVVEVDRRKIGEIWVTDSDIGAIHGPQDFLLEKDYFEKLGLDQKWFDDAFERAIRNLRLRRMGLRQPSGEQSP